MSLRTLLIASLSPTLFIAPLAAQNITGSVLGTVTDTSGAVVSAAEITVANKDTGQTARLESNQLGYFEAPLLRPGSYEIKVARPGFKTVVRNNVQVQVESRVRLDFSLEVGDAATSIAITGDAPLLEADTASLGQVISARTVMEMPIRGRNVFDLAALSPGVQVNPRSQGAVASTGDNSAPLFVLSDISINGGRFRTNEYMLDGVSIMLPENNNFAISPSPDGTQEFKVMTNSYGPQFGRSGGGVINVITRGGTNQFHATLYEFFRNDRLKANNFFANARNQKRGIFHFNQFGAAGGGPVIRNKTFFFADYQGHRERTTAGGLFATVPTAAQRAGDFSQTFNAQGQPVIIYDPATTIPNPSGAGFLRTAFPGNRIPSNRFDPAAVKLLSFVPLPNGPGSTAALVNNFSWAQQFAINSNQWSVRLDHSFSDRHTIFGRVTRNSGDSSNNGPFDTPADNVLGITLNKVWNAVINDTFAFSPTRLLNWRYGLSRRFEGRVPLHEGEVTLSQLGFPRAVEAAAPEQIFPQVTFSNYTNGLAWRRSHPTRERHPHGGS
ncbi:MAG: carboxypeptidase-like regulatory domain-containing protein [Bryobacteraceae bacterium]